MDVGDLVLKLGLLFDSKGISWYELLVIDFCERVKVEVTICRREKGSGPFHVGCFSKDVNLLLIGF